MSSAKGYPFPNVLGPDSGTFALFLLVAIAMTFSDYTYNTLDLSAGSIAFTDQDGKIVWSDANQQSDWNILLDMLCTSMSTKSYYTLDTNFMPAGSIVVVDVDNKIISILSSDSLLAIVSRSSGTASTLETRLSKGLTPYGDLLLPTYNTHLLRQSRRIIQQRVLGESAQLIINIIGDSYTQNWNRYTQAFTKTLQDTYGNAGVGWISFAWFGTAVSTWTQTTQPTGLDITARTDLITFFQIIGGWTRVYNSASTNALQISTVTSSTPNDYIKFTIPAGHQGINLYYTGGTGVIQVSWDDGITYGSNIALSGTTATSMALSGIPSTTTTARIKVVSGTVVLSGVELTSNGSGVRVNKFGGSGSSTTPWSGVDKAQWAAQFATTNPNLVFIFHGTNDQGTGTTPETFAANLNTIVSNIRSAIPATRDICIVMPSENQRTNNKYTMESYAKKARELCVNLGIAYMDTQFYFGDPSNPNSYGASATDIANRLYNSDLIHPEPLTGGRVLCRAFLDLLLK